MRLEAYTAALERAGADAFVLTSEAALRHSTGVFLYTQRLIPQRPVAAVLRPRQQPRIICCVLEADQLAAEHPGLDLVTFREFGDDPWRHAAAALSQARRIVVEDTMPAAWVDALRERLAGAEVMVSYDVPLEPRLVKDAGEVALLERASRAAEAAVARGAALLEPGRTEREIADAIAGALRGTEKGTSDVAGLCIGPQHNRAMHHEPRGVPLPERGPVRLGVLGRVEGYWVLITRMAVLGEDASFEEAYERYVDVYEAGLADLHAGAEPRALYEACRDRAADAGFTLETLKIGHGTGLDFRERPWLAPWDDLALVPGMVLAYDYGLVSREGVALHLEDRVLVEASGPRRLSSGWMLRDLRSGHGALLGAQGRDA